MYKKRCKLDVLRSISKTNSKKGQVTVFIIIGIVLVLALALVIAVQTEVIKFGTDEVSPPEEGKVGSFISTCIKNIGEDAIHQIGLQGGYVTVPNSIANDGFVHLRTSPFQVIPYWAVGSTTNIPTLDDLKLRIDQHLEQNLKACVFNSQAFQETYDLIEKSDISSDTKIENSKVIFNIQWNVELREKSGSLVGEVLQHRAESPIKLKKTHFLATRIVEKELQNLKLEDIAQDLIALDHPNVPISGVEISCSQKTWDVSKVKESLQGLLSHNIQQLKIQGTNFEEFPEDLPYYSSHYIWNVGEDIDEDELSVSFDYEPSYPFTFGVTPLTGSKLKSSQLGGSDVLSFLCIQNWKFTYDLEFPVRVRVRDETTGYNFNFAFTVHLIRNEPNRGLIIARPTTTFETVTDEAFCNTRDIPMTVKTYEHITNEEGVDFRNDLGDVALSYTCIKYKCELGNADYNFGDQGFSGLTTNFPYCVGGILRGTRDGYKETWERVITSAGQEIELNLVPLYKFPHAKVTILKHELLEDGSMGQGIPLSTKESALITLTYRKSNDPVNQPSHETTFVRSFDIDPKVVEESEFELLAKADFPYDVDITLIDDKTIMGGYEGVWNVEWAELQSAQEMVFHVFTTQKDNEEELASLLIAKEATSKNLPKPELK
ncbi:hypothetical protein HOD05_05395 [Candidatus Woesearchaeota archaeon]|jgi:hypothetical protein|nr:hypothetical protein [Candidatus Woesearchaeota archaeon]MBT4150515.1 hypothetical protein [Candidatus Woesearchaeota archaeon]MBT4247155.1 hypothetical protein [Candidatus Woesearchaeota archaeon]MBT4434619.1 hypothetical protein [Candidatus Woesearchaeota archaeon]MBT7332529.1 hypothetical protein [Candidatus Woesearchaeota archaeon]